MSKLLKSRIELFTIFVVAIVGSVGLVAQVAQFFTSKWTYEWYIEVGILILFFIMTRYPHKIVHLFDLMLSGLNRIINSKFGVEDSKKDGDVGGGGTEDEDIDV